MQTLTEILNAKFTALVGSGPQNDVVLAGPGVAARHCQISKIEDGKFLLVDLASASGTFVNNKKIEREIISDTDFITVGDHIFQLRSKLTTPQPAAAAQPAAAPLPNFNDHEEPQPAAAPELLRVRYDGEKATAVSDAAQKTITVYLLAAPEDEATCNAINKHLSSIHFNSATPVEITGDFNIPAGTDIKQYQQKLYEADIVLAFISVDFLNNDACYERIKKVIANHNNRKSVLLPILARNCMWKATPFSSLPLLPKNQQPLNNKQFWNSEDDALTEVVNDIYKSINDFSQQTAAEKTTAQALIQPILQVEWRQNYLWTAFWKRLVASLLDSFIIGIPLYLLFYIMGMNSLSQAAGSYDTYGNYYPGEDVAGELVLYYLLIVAIQIVIYAFMESSVWRGTPGKRIMKLQITDDAGHPISFKKSVLRNVIKLLIFAFFSVGNGVLLLVYLVAQTLAFMKTKKFFHDQLSNTVIGERLT